MKYSQRSNDVEEEEEVVKVRERPRAVVRYCFICRFASYAKSLFWNYKGLVICIGTACKNELENNKKSLNALLKSENDFGWKDIVNREAAKKGKK